MNKYISSLVILFLTSFNLFSQYELICIEHIGTQHFNILPVYFVKGLDNYIPIVEERDADGLFFQPMDSATFEKTDSLFVNNKLKKKLNPNKIKWGSFKIYYLDSNNKERYVYYTRCSKKTVKLFRSLIDNIQGFPNPKGLTAKFTYFIELLELGDEKIKNEDTKN